MDNGACLCTWGYHIPAHALNGAIFYIILGVYFEVGFLDQTGILCLTFWGPAKLLSKVAVPFHSPTLDVIFKNSNFV